MNDKLPPMPGHPEPHTMVWSRLERETIEAYGKACWDAAIEHQSAAPQPQPVPPQAPMAETVEQAARDVAKCLNERDGQGLDLRHVAMLVHYAQQPVQRDAEKAELDRMAKYVSTITQSEIDEADSDRGITSPQLAQPQPVQEPVAWYEHNPDLDAWFLAYTKNPSQNIKSRPLVFGDVAIPQAQPAQPLSDEQISLIYRQLTDEARKKFGTVLSFARAIEQAHGIPKGTT